MSKAGPGGGDVQACSERLPYMEAACLGAGVPTRYVVGT